MRIPMLVLMVTAALTLAGCAPMAHELNGRNANAHWMAARRASHDQDWAEARRQWGLTLMNVRLAQAGPDDEASVLYEYGRVLGITCDYPQAERMLKASLQLKRQTGAQPYLPLLELAELAEHQGQPRQAIAYFRELVPMIDAEGLAHTHPLGVAAVLRRYANLLAANGDAAGAAEQRERADALASGNPDAIENGGDTPYGSACIAPT